MLASAGADVRRAQLQSREQGHGFQIFDFHVPGHGNDAELTVGLAHGFVEECRDNASVYVAGRTFEASRDAHVAYDAMLVVDEKFETKTGTVLLSAAEAVVQGAVLKGHQLLR